MQIDFGLGIAPPPDLLLHTETVRRTASTVLEIAYVAGGASMVSQKIDLMVADGKITPEQAALLKAAAQTLASD